MKKTVLLFLVFAFFYTGVKSQSPIFKSFKPNSTNKDLIVVDSITVASFLNNMLFSGNILRQPCMSDVGGSRYRVLGSLPNSDRIVQDTFWVGVYPGMSDEMIDDMAEIILRESARG